MVQILIRLRSRSRIGTLYDSPLLLSNTDMKGLLGAIIIGFTMLLSGCGGVLLVGAGVGAGAFSYIAGNVIRIYEADYQQSIEASTKVMKQLVFKGKEESEDGLKTVIEGYRYYDTPITIEVAFVEPGSTQIGIRTGYLGNRNLEISEQLHSDIAKELTRLAPPNLKAAARKKNVSDPPTLPAASQTEKVLPEENEVRSSRTLYDDLPPPPKSVSASTANESDNTLSIDFGQETHTPSQTENEQEIAEEFQARATENDDGTESPVSEMISVPMDSVSTPLAGEPDNVHSIDFGQETHTQLQSESDQDITEELQAKVTEKEDDIVSPMLEPVPSPLDSDMEETGQIQEQQELQALLIPESKDKIFTYYPASEQTIHSGAYGVFDEVIAYLNENPTARVDIRAYSDSSADASRTIALLKKRVFEIRNYLILHGVSEERILAQGLGENNFLEVDNSEHQGPQMLPVDMVIR